MRGMLFVLVLLTGCAALTPPPDESRLVGGAVETTLTTLQAAAERQRQDLASAEQAHAKHPDRSSGLRLALLLATLPPPLRDDERALALLESMSGQPPATPLGAFAILFASQVRERRASSQALADSVRREEDLMRREADARQAAEDREQELERRLSALRALESREAALLRRQADALRVGEQREAMLRRQIERLRASERSLIEREEQLGAKKR